MELDSLKTLNELKLTKINCRYQLRFAADNVKVEASGLISDSKQLAKAGIVKLGVGYLSSILQKQLIRYFRK